MNRNMRSSIAILIIIFMFGFAGCAKHIEVVPVNKRPLPSGEVSVIKDAGGATAYQLRVANILAPSELETAAQYYIVWAISQDSLTFERVGEWQGRIKQQSFLIKTAMINPRFTITAESNLNVTQPTGPAVLRDITIEPVQGY